MKLRTATDGKIGLPSNPRPKLNKAQTGKLLSPLLNPNEEVTFKASRSISRSAKPPSLHLQRSNGSTAASISSISTNASESPMVPFKISPPPIPPLSKARNSRDKQQQLSKGTSDLNPIQASDERKAKNLSLSNTSPSRKPLPEVRSPHDGRPLPSIPASTKPSEKALPPISNASLGEEIDDVTPEPVENLAADHNSVTVPSGNIDEQSADMKRFKDLVKRKPVRSDSNATLSPTGSDAVNKENKPFHSSPALGSFFGSIIHPSRPNLIDSSNSKQTLEATSETNSNQNTHVASPADSHVQLSHYPQASASISQETVTAGFRQPSSEDGIEELPSTPRPPPALLPQASPMSQLPESPSKYAVDLYSSNDMQLNNDVSARDNARRRVVSGITEFKVSLLDRIYP
jgi:hypothetical protein